MSQLKVSLLCLLFITYSILTWALPPKAFPSFSPSPKAWREGARGADEGMPVRSSFPIFGKGAWGTIDKEQILQVAADSAHLSQKDHRGTYLGHVALIQGSTHLEAARAITEGNVKNQLVFAQAQGDGKKQAHYWVKPDPHSPILHAYADSIRYYPLKHLIELIGHAHIKQGTDSLTAHQITYDLLKQEVLTASASGERTTIVYTLKQSNGMELSL